MNSTATLSLILGTVGTNYSFQHFSRAFPTDVLLAHLLYFVSFIYLNLKFGTFLRLRTVSSSPFCVRVSIHSIHDFNLSFCGKLQAPQ